MRYPKHDKNMLHLTVIDFTYNNDNRIKSERISFYDFNSEMDLYDIDTLCVKNLIYLEGYKIEKTRNHLEYTVSFEKANDMFKDNPNFSRTSN